MRMDTRAFLTNFLIYFRWPKIVSQVFTVLERTAMPFCLALTINDASSNTVFPRLHLAIEKRTIAFSPLRSKTANIYLRKKFVLESKTI